VVKRMAGEELSDRERFLTSKRATHARCGDGFQQLGLKLIRVLGSGSNNKVEILTNESGAQYVGRFPRQNSYTQVMHRRQILHGLQRFRIIDLMHEQQRVP